VNEILKTALPNLAPHFVESLKDAVVTELATQRRDLLFAQQAAAAEIADLARRLENAQAPLLERLRAYEQRIGELESELVSQSKQNRELLQLKIEMLRQQIDTERTGRPASFN
jgi:rubrerythrin